VAVRVGSRAPARGVGAFGDWGRMIGRGRCSAPTNNQLADDSIEASNTNLYIWIAGFWLYDYFYW